jgi:hypothetical protein
MRSHHIPFKDARKGFAEPVFLTRARPSLDQAGHLFLFGPPLRHQERFVSITLPFVLTRGGFSVAIAASIVATGVSANLWRFLWGPVADPTLTARRWYLLGLGTSALTLLILSLMPLHKTEVGILHRDCTSRFAKNLGPVRDYSALIKQSGIAFLHGR